MKKKLREVITMCVEKNEEENVEVIEIIEEIMNKGLMNVGNT